MTRKLSVHSIVGVFVAFFWLLVLLLIFFSRSITRRFHYFYLDSYFSFLHETHTYDNHFNCFGYQLLAVSRRCLSTNRNNDHILWATVIQMRLRVFAFIFIVVFFTFVCPIISSFQHLFFRQPTKPAFLMKTHIFSDIADVY